MAGVIGAAALLVALVGALVVALAPAARAQGVAPTGPAPVERVIEGRLVRPGAGRTQPVAGAWAALHRVGADTAGPLDSMRTRADGGFRFRFRPSGDTSAVYFVSATRGGVAYFTSPLRAGEVRGAAPDLLVFDTTSAPIPIAVVRRHLIFPAPDSAGRGVRTVIEVFELGNDSTLTRVASSGGATFESALPLDVAEIVVGQGDLSPDAVRVLDGRLRISAPLSPGVKQLSFYYERPVTTAAMAFPLEQSVGTLEVLVEDAAATATGAGLEALGPAEIEGRVFRRFLARDTPAGATIQVTAPGAATAGRRAMSVMLVITAVGAAMLLGLGMIFLKRGPRAFARRRDDDPESLALAIAALDAGFERLAAPTEAQRNEHYLARARLKGRLNAALAKRDGLG